MAKALLVANKTLAERDARISELTVQNTIMLPKARYFDELISRNTLTNFRETAKELGISEKAFIRFLIDKSTFSATSAASSCRMQTAVMACLKSRNVTTKRPTGAASKP